MFKFDKEQTVFDFGGVKMGGQPGEYPTVLCGTIFYGGHNIVNDELTGDFDKEKADKLFAELKEQGYKPGSEFFNRWLRFEAYRKIVFRDSIY